MKPYSPTVGCVGALLLSFLGFNEASYYVPAGCPASLTQYDAILKVHNHVCYMFELEYRRSYHDAEHQCEQLGGTLALVKSWDVSNFLASVLNAYDYTHPDVVRVWIGLNDRDVEGRFTWEDGTTLGWSNWAHDGGMYPQGGSNHDNKDCVYMNKWQNYMWHAQHCYNWDYTAQAPLQLAFICQFTGRGTVLPPVHTAKPGSATDPLSSSTCVDQLQPPLCDTYDCSRQSALTMCPRSCSFCPSSAPAATAAPTKHTPRPTPSKATTTTPTTLAPQTTDCVDKLQPPLCDNYDCGRQSGRLMCPRTCGLCHTGDITDLCPDIPGANCDTATAKPAAHTSSPTTTTTTTDAATTAPQCPDSLKLDSATFLEAHGGQCYMFDLGRRAGFTDAESTCAQLGGTLVLVKSQDVSDFLFTVMQSHHDYDKTIKDGVWIGLTDRDAENKFHWVDGTPLHWAHWDGGRLGNSKNDDINDCVYVYPWDDTWYTGACDGEHKPYVCQFDPSAATTAPMTTTTTTTTTTPPPTTTQTTTTPKPTTTTTTTTTATPQPTTTTTTTPKPTTTTSTTTPQPTTTTTTTPQPTTNTTTTTTTPPPAVFLCSPFTCDKDCGLDGYQVDTQGCSVCACNA